MLKLQAKIVLDRARKARADRQAATEHGTGANAEFYARRAEFWEDAALRAAKGDLSPVQFAEGETRAAGVNVILVVVR